MWGPGPGIQGPDITQTPVSAASSAPILIQLIKSSFQHGSLEHVSSYSIICGSRGVDGARSNNQILSTLYWNAPEAGKVLLCYK